MPLFIVNAPLEEDVLSMTDIENDLYFTNIIDSAPTIFIIKTITNAFTRLKFEAESFELKRKSNINKRHIKKLTQIGMSLAYEKDFAKLLKDILYSAREISGADSGSLYLVERDDDGNLFLRFKISSMDLEGNEFILPINKKSIAGYVADTKKPLNLPDAYNLDDNTEYKFNGEYDKAKNYHTKSMLTVPMKNHRDEIIGVLQLINRKKNFEQKITKEEIFTDKVFSFDQYTEDLVMSVAGQAAVAIQNNNLIQEIETLFESFVKASVSAIEARDPTTSGHSFRVAELTVGLAEVVDKINEGIYANIKFSKEQIKEIRYASLLHDFGKVGVREKVLVKAKKLETYEMELIKWRIYYIQKDIQHRIANKKIEYLKKYGAKGFAEYELNLENKYQKEVEKLQKMEQTISMANEPTILEESNSTFLEQISKVRYTFLDGTSNTIITPNEHRLLSIKRGSLDEEERKEIESHVIHTYQFLKQIPWTQNLKMIPNIAHAHHEKLDGSGYPLKLKSEEIPVQSKMMTIADIFDALTDKDRPYKKAVPLERALDILKMEVRDNHIDPILLEFFVQAKVYELVLNKKNA
ncbi:MAG: GAF domain-containing protein [Leptospiraceae bacterium]|nr:GAF domain-containing protein [Leptospiraceae bacterium]MCP5494533.1 GAF domain-containing protein [Leptospiraceae bacterium]